MVGGPVAPRVLRIAQYRLNGKVYAITRLMACGVVVAYMQYPTRE